jgi:hypothetical protein
MIPKVNVSVDTYQLAGIALPQAQVRLTLTRPDIVKDTGEIVALGSGIIQCDDAGHGVGPFFPNDAGTQGTQYLVEIFDQNGMQVFPAGGRQVPAVIPVMDIALHACLFKIAPLSLSDAQYWSGDARNWAMFLGGDIPSTPGSRSAKSWAQDNLIGATYGGSAKDWAQGAGLIDGVTYKSARSYALDAAGSAVAALASQTLADADRVQTGLDRVQTGLDRSATGLSATQASGSSLRSPRWFLRPCSSAAAALSVVQQDLSGASAQALHRSPNAVVGTPSTTWPLTATPRGPTVWTTARG